MKPRLSDIWSWEGPLSRGTYAFWGILLAALKYNLDRAILQNAGGQVRWPLELYWIPGDAFQKLMKDPSLADLRWAMLLSTLPFLWSGVALTMRRLRSAGLPFGLVLLFFVPFVNALFFAFLAMVPSVEPGPRPEGRLGRCVPRSRWGGAAMAMACSVLPHLLVLVLATNLFETYAWGTFVGIPFQVGLFSALIHSYHHRRWLGECFGVTCASLLLLALCLFALAVEGLICIAMAAPIALGIGFLGTLLGWWVADLVRGRSDGAMFALLAALPALLGTEAASAREPEEREVRTSVEVDAPPDRVWRHVVSFSEIPPPEESLFRTGLAYPLRAEIRGTGVGAVRHCVFTTGAFVEPITAWEEPRRLEFDVASQPAPMHEWTPYPGVPPPHLDGYFRSRRGRFLLEPLPGGRTRLEGTTVYTNRLWPEAYWSLWSDAIIHRIHGRVLRHVKGLAEARE